ncbi:MAG: hypothetical protein PHX83_06575 [Acidobacteriia bacterium]|nr:hypothetical protein [Terriglobia bacterium]
MPTWLKRAQAVEDEIERPEPPKAQPTSMANAWRKAGMTMREAAEAFGARWKCSYCGAAIRGERCGNCGGPREDNADA